MKKPRKSTRSPRKDTSSPDQTEPADVKLSPLFGIAPGYYLAAFGVFLVLLLLFVILALPGIRDSTRAVSVDTSPPAASLYHNGRRIGSTPGTFALPRGEQQIRLKRPGFEEAVIDIDVPGRWFATLLFPPHKRLHLALAPSDNASSVLKSAAGRELSSWAKIGESSVQRPIPPVLTTFARDAVAGGLSEEDRSQFLLSSAQNITSHSMLRDLVNAFWEHSGAGSPPGPIAAGEVVSHIIHLHTHSEGFLTWIDSVGGDALSDALRETSLLERELSRNRQTEDGYARSLEDELTELPPQSQRSIAGIPFHLVPSGRVLLGYSGFLGNSDRGAIRLPARVDEFWIARSPVSVESWQRFLNDNPEWDRSHIDELTAAGLVDSDYLSHLANQGTGEPVVGISWHAARAFAEWLDERAGPELRITLPTEAQWARAAALDSVGEDLGNRVFGLASGVRSLEENPDARTGRLGLIDMIGNSWEWTSTPWYEADSFLRLHNDLLRGVGRPGYYTVRGGSWANSQAQIGPESRGGQHATWATPFLGFRIVAMEAGDG